MAKLPTNFQESQTVLAIYAAYEAANKPRPSRRLGASVIGKQCPRAIWYSFRWAASASFAGRTLRLFETGQLAESRFVANLRAIGCTVVDRDEATGAQIEYTQGHIVAKLDAVAVGIPEAPKTWHACEFKTHNAKSFTELRSKGLRVAKPEHYAQLVVGMALANLTRGLYLAVNKDTDELYAERVRIEEADAPRLLAFADSIVAAPRAPERIAEDRDAIPCKWCDFAGVCYGNAPPAPAVAASVNCRTCCHSTARPSGDWHCERHGKAIDLQEQIRACDDHLFLPDFITFATVTDGGEDNGVGYVEYQSPGGKWRNGKSDGAYRSLELTVLPSPLVAGVPLVDAVKRELGAVVQEVT